jgi:hypothetical protein
MLCSKKYKLLSLVVTLDANNIDFQTCCSYQLYAFKICFSIIRMQTAGFKILLFLSRFLVASCYTVEMHVLQFSDQIFTDGFFFTRACYLLDI